MRAGPARRDVELQVSVPEYRDRWASNSSTSFAGSAWRIGWCASSTTSRWYGPVTQLAITSTDARDTLSEPGGQMNVVGAVTGGSSSRAQSGMARYQW